MSLDDVKLVYASRMRKWLPAGYHQDSLTRLYRRADILQAIAELNQRLPALKESRPDMERRCIYFLPELYDVRCSLFLPLLFLISHLPSAQDESSGPAPGNHSKRIYALPSGGYVTFVL